MNEVELQVLEDSSPQTNEVPTLSTFRDLAGYKIFSRYVASNDDFFVIRRFDTLNSRIILRLQWELTEIESRLNVLDRHSVKGEPLCDNGSFKKDAEENNERDTLLIHASQKLKIYNEFVLTHSTLKSRKRATQHSISCVEDWLQEFRGAIASEETQFLDYKEDLIQLNALVHTPLRRYLESLRRFRWMRFFRREPHIPERERGDLPHYHRDFVSHENGDRVDTFVSVVVGTVGLLMLVTPLWILIFVSSPKAQLGVITAFVVLFLLLVQSVTVAKPFEALAATAAYAAVLMVFMQIGSAPKPSA